MTKEERRSGRDGAVGTWILPAALVILIGISLAWRSLPSFAPGAARVAPIQRVEGGQVVEVDGEHLLDINLASAEQLMQLPGIGEVLAGRIVSWREENGAFVSVEQLMEVSGIGEAKLSAIRQKITVVHKEK